MPKKEINDYIFYKIVCISDDIDLCYVGSTANWKARNHCHKSRCNNENNNSYNSKIYKTIRENGGWCNFKMVQVGTREQLTKREAEQVEEEYRVALKSNMNGQRCFTTVEERQEQNRERCIRYSEENKDKLKEYQEKYREEYREIINKKQKEKVKCVCGCEVRKSVLSRHQKTTKHIKLMNQINSQ